jgi:polar amino acid transport system substrate-binding protein
MIMKRMFALALGLLFIVLGNGVEAAEQPLPDRTLVVGTKEAPPFSMKTSRDNWTGISIDFWRRIASELNMRFELRELTLQQLIDGVADGSLDAAVAALTITSEREKLLDFTHPFYTTGLGIAVAAKPGSPWLSVLKRFLSFGFLKIAAALALLLFGVGALVWLFERKKNQQQFGGGAAKGIGSGFWWSAVTMTTVGYGDKAPVTVGGRIMALVWMFAAIIIISSFTAAITSALTVTQLESTVKGPEDLPKARVGTIPKTTSASYLQDNQVSYRAYETPRDALKAICEGKIDAFVYDAPILRYLVNKEFLGKLEVLRNTFLRQDYGIALPTGSPLREPINRILLEKIEELSWQDILHRYLGH